MNRPITCTTIVLSSMWAVAWAQSSKPVRVAAPTFQPGQFEGIFFSDPSSQLRGEMPTIARQAPTSIPAPVGSAPPAAHGQAGVGASLPWKELIAATSLEDLVKGSKLRLDKIVTTPTAFKGGGFVAARMEFSLQAVLFAIIESYPGDVRWKGSAAEARRRFTRVAANTKVGSDQVFAEAKARMLDLGELLGGSPLAANGDVMPSEIAWSNLIDRVPLMQLLNWAQEKNLSKLVASEVDFKANREAVQRYAELVAVLGQVALAEDMADATDADYQALARAMIQQAGQVVMAVKTDNAELARTAAAQIGQVCTNCHDSFR